MPVRKPLILDGDANLVEMSTAQILAIKNRCRYLYGTNPSVNLSRVASGGTLGSLVDTRKQAGAMSTDATNFDTESETAEPTTVTVNRAHITQVADNTVGPTNTDNRAFPVFFNGFRSIRAMSNQDIYDTFVLDAIDTITSANGQPGTFTIHTSTTLSGFTAVSTDFVFRDTRADLSLYTAAGIGETLDQPQTIQDYFLLKANNIAAPDIEKMLYITDTDFDLQEYTNTQIDAILLAAIRHNASEVAGTQIRYNFDGAGVNLGSGITNTILNGSGNYQTRFVNTNDYRAQEFPNGTAVTAATFRLKMGQT